MEELNRYNIAIFSFFSLNLLKSYNYIALDIKKVTIRSVIIK